MMIYVHTIPAQHVYRKGPSCCFVVSVQFECAGPNKNRPDPFEDHNPSEGSPLKNSAFDSAILAEVRPEEGKNETSRRTFRTAHSGG
mmetsp:Transcript_25567/g.59391  ORF Transcript_25567/g.59391 Transcript_25567/m.59391 type:complete len:87 (-) Transcript_25567:556-816(-)